MKKLILLFMLVPGLLYAQPYNYPPQRQPKKDRLKKYYKKLFDNYVPGTDIPSLPQSDPASVIPEPIKINLLQLNLYETSAFRISVYDEYDTISGHHMEYGVQFTFKR